MASYLFLNAHP